MKQLNDGHLLWAVAGIEDLLHIYDVNTIKTLKELYGEYFYSLYNYIPHIGK